MRKFGVLGWVFVVQWMLHFVYCQLLGILEAIEYSEEQTKIQHIKRESHVVKMTKHAAMARFKK